MPNLIASALYSHAVAPTRRFAFPTVSKNREREIGESSARGKKVEEECAGQRERTIGTFEYRGVRRRLWARRRRLFNRGRHCQRHNRLRINAKPRNT